MDQTTWDRLERGDIVRNIGSGKSAVVHESYRHSMKEGILTKYEGVAHLIAETQLIMNPAEWELVRSAETEDKTDVADESAALREFNERYHWHYDGAGNWYSVSGPQGVIYQTNDRRDLDMFFAELCERICRARKE